MPLFFTTKCPVEVEKIEYACKNESIIDFEAGQNQTKCNYFQTCKTCKNPFENKKSNKRKVKVVNQRDEKLCQANYFK